MTWQTLTLTVFVQSVYQEMINSYTELFHWNVHKFGHFVQKFLAKRDRQFLVTITNTFPVRFLGGLRTTIAINRSPIPLQKANTLLGNKCEQQIWVTYLLSVHSLSPKILNVVQSYLRLILAQDGVYRGEVYEVLKFLKCSYGICHKLFKLYSIGV